MIANEDLFISHKKFEDPEDEDRELKRKSKIVEWTITTKKAKRLRDKTFYQLLETDYRGRFYYSQNHS